MAHPVVDPRLPQTPPLEGTHTGPDGGERSRSFRTRREAERYEREQRVAKDRGVYVDPRSASSPFSEVAARWLASNPGKRRSTLERDEVIVRRHLVPVLGAMPMGRITPPDVQGLVTAWVGAGVAPRTVRRQYGVLRAVCAWAVAADLIGRTPCRSVKLPEVRSSQRHQLTPEEVGRVAVELGEYAPMVYLGAALGLRWGEVAGLRVGRLDFLGRTVTVAEQRTRGKGEGAFGEPKSVAGRRTLAAPVWLMELLSASLAARGVTGADAEALVFVGRRGRALDYSHWRQRVWAPAAQRAGLEGLGFHDLRRANATALVAEGVDVKTAQTRLGRSDVRLTLQTYAQAVGELDRTAAEKVGGRFQPAAGGASAALPRGQSCS